MRVKSSMIRTVQHNKNTKVLQVSFRNGSQYRYEEVPNKIAKRVMTNASPGRAFLRNVRDQYPTTQISQGKKKR